MTRRSPSIVVITLLSVVGLVFAQGVNTSPTAILADPDHFDAQSIIISGTVADVQERVSRAGNPYYTLDLSDGKQAIRVFSFGRAPCRAGTVTVEGTFNKVKRQGQYTFYNEVTATRVTCR